MPRHPAPEAHRHHRADEKEPVAYHEENEGDERQDQFLGKKLARLASLDEEELMACLEVDHQSTHDLMETGL